MRRTAFWIAYTAACTVFLELALQAYYRVTAGEWLAARTALPLFAADEDSGFRLRPNFSFVHATSEFRTRIFTDGDGLRVPAPGMRPAGEKRAGVTRVLLLGPSFAFGWGVDYEATFLARLRHLLPPAGDELEILNAGVPALGPVQQLAWYRSRGHAYRPDLVIQLVYGSLAVSREYSEGYRVDARGRLVPRDRSVSRRLRGELKKSATLFYGWLAWSRVGPSGAESTRGPAGAGREIAPVARFDPGAPAVRTAIEFYEELAATTSGSGARLLVVYLPLAYVVHPEDARRWRHLGALDAEASRRFNAEFAAFLTARGIDCLDLTDDLVRAASVSGERLYYPVDIHWTPRGHEVAAGVVAKHLGTGTGLW